MSRGFTKEDDALPAPIVPPRAPLPAGVPNYVTPRGLALLRAELAMLENARAQLDAHGTADAQARTQALLVLNGRISALTSRLTSARVISPQEQAPTEVRFGATVTIRPVTGGSERRFTIVGVDEADAGSGRVAFTSPIARAVQGKCVGDQATLRAAGGEEDVTVVAISYATEVDTPD